MKIIAAVFRCLLCDSYNNVTLCELHPGYEFPSAMMRHVMAKADQGAAASSHGPIYFPPCPTCSVFLHGVHLREFIANPLLEAACPPAVWVCRPRMYLATAGSAEAAGKPPKFRLLAALRVEEKDAGDEDEEQHQADNHQADPQGDARLGESAQGDARLGESAQVAPMRLEFDNFGGGRLRRAPFTSTRRSEFNDALDIKPQVVAHMMDMVERALALAGRGEAANEHSVVFRTLLEGRVLERWVDVGYVFEDLVYTHAYDEK